MTPHFAPGPEAPKGEVVPVDLALLDREWEAIQKYPQGALSSRLDLIAAFPRLSAELKELREAFAILNGADKTNVLLEKRALAAEAEARQLRLTLDYIANGVDNPRAVAHEALAASKEKPDG